MEYSDDEAAEEEEEQRGVDKPVTARAFYSYSLQVFPSVTPVRADIFGCQVALAAVCGGSICKDRKPENWRTSSTTRKNSLQEPHGGRATKTGFD